jgi:predicted RNase H-like HicB family nuclease
MREPPPAGRPIDPPQALPAMQPSVPSASATVLRSGIENFKPNCWVLSVFDLIGCFSSGRTEEEAVAQAGRRVRQYFEWLGRKDGNPAPFEDAVQVVVAERVEAHPWPRDPTLTVHAFFEDDARPLRTWDLDMACRLLEWNRQDLLQLAGAELPDSLNAVENIPTWKTHDGLLAHLWETENAILNRMGVVVDPAGMPGDAMGRLEVVRAKLVAMLPEWVEADAVREEFGEKWSPRKALRRALWHERDHIRQLESVLGNK